MKDTALGQKVKSSELHSFESKIAVKAALNEVCLSAYFLDDIRHLLTFEKLCNLGLV